VRERLRPLLDNLATFVAPGLVLLLLGIQVAFGLRGFDRPDERAVIYVLQVPGVLLGWGGVVLLVPLLVWMVLDWWGYNLGGFALKGLGSAVLGIASGALCGLAGDVAGGGLVGGGLADVLRQGVGGALAFVVLALMALPAGILAFSLQRRAPRPAPATEGEAEQTRSGGGVLSRILGGRRKAQAERGAWYPERRFDTDGNEIPMSFERHRDIGGIRFADDDPAGADASRDDTGEDDTEPVVVAHEVPAGDVMPGEERLPTIPELLAGNYRGEQRLFFEDDPSGGPRESELEEPDDGPIHVGSDGRPRKRTAHVAWVRPTQADPEPDDDEPAQQTLAFMPAREPQPIAVSEPSLPAGVRWADDPAPPEEEPAEDDEPLQGEPADLPALSAALEHAVRGPAAAAEDARHTARSVRETLRQRVDAIRADGTSNRYMAKLESIGLFDMLEPPPADDAPASGVAGTTRAEDAPAEEGPAEPPASAKKKARKKASRRKSAGKTSAVRRPPTTKKPAARRKPAATRLAEGQRDEPPQVETQPQAARQRERLVALRGERTDPLFTRAVEASLARGAASPVLLTRRLGLPLARANVLIERMVAVGVLAEASPTGSHALRISAADWEAAGAP